MIEHIYYAEYGYILITVTYYLIYYSEKYCNAIRFLFKPTNIMMHKL